MHRKWTVFRALLVVSSLLVCSAVSRAQGTPGFHIGVAGGALLPVEDQQDVFNTGWNAMLLFPINFGTSPTHPVQQLLWRAHDEVFPRRFPGRWKVTDHFRNGEPRHRPPPRRRAALHHRWSGRLRSPLQRPGSRHRKPLRGLFDALRMERGSRALVLCRNHDPALRRGSIHQHLARFQPLYRQRAHGRASLHARPGERRHHFLKVHSMEKNGGQA